jgi:hypothetical protein
MRSSSTMSAPVAVGRKMKNLPPSVPTYNLPVSRAPGEAFEEMPRTLGPELLAGW